MSASAHMVGIYPAGGQFKTIEEGIDAVPPFEIEGVPDLGFEVIPGNRQPIPIHPNGGATELMLQANDGGNCKIQAVYDIINFLKVGGDSYLQEEFKETFDEFGEKAGIPPN